MDWKKLGKALLFPHIAIMIILAPVSAVMLIGSMVFVGTQTPVAYISYVLAAYTLTVWCLKMPDVVRFFKTFKEENRYVRKWREDARLRVNISLFSSLLWNVAYAIFQIWLGFYHHTFWFSSIGAYYICLAVMRFFLVCHTSKYRPGEKMREELIKYRACGWVFLALNMALSVIIFFMIYWNRTFEHHTVTSIAMAAYTFASFCTAVVNVVKYRKYESPVFSASKAISFASACVSMLTLTSTMLTTFSDGEMDAVSQKWMLGAVGVAVSLVVLSLAVGMIVKSTKKLRYEVDNGK